MMGNSMTALRLVIVLVLHSAKGNSESFTNLNFELGRFRGDFPTFDTTEVLIPGWTLTFDGQVQTVMAAGSGAMGSPTAWLADRRFSDVLQGRFSAGLVPGFTSPSEPRHWAHYGLSQKGDIPAEARTLRFLAWGIFDVRVDGVSLDLVDESPADLWVAADVSPFAGRNILLEFYTTQGSPEMGASTHGLDAIEFSPNPIIPEPSQLLIITCGMGALVLMHRPMGTRT